MNAVVNLSHRFDLPPDALFALLLDPTAWWDEDATGTLDATVGGAFTSSDECGTVRAMEAAQKLTLELDDDTLVLLVLNAGLDGTELTVLHTRFESGTARDEYLPRWQARITRLAALATPA